ncbi:flavin reductase family protein [Corynebacterium nasicanis]|uniref:Flavin reductase family protein n=1 Tax=Corynebacterium nasicanis TaxID=1448267 RepID=A0ABW1QEQ7_9CORY
MSTTLTRPHLRPVLAHVPTPLVAVAALVDGRPTGLVLGSFVGLSLDPPLIGLSVQTTSSTWPLLRDAPEVGISVLGSAHAGIARQLGGPAADRFTGVAWSARGQTVLLDDAVAHLRAHLVDEVLTGDHVFAVLQVTEATADGAVDPLVFHGSRVRSL